MLSFVEKKGQRIIPYEEGELLKRLNHQPTEISNPIDLSEALQHLSHAHQMALILYYYHDLPIKQISQMMDKPSSTIKTYLHRGKKTLKTRIRKERNIQ